MVGFDVAWLAQRWRAALLALLAVVAVVMLQHLPLAEASRERVFDGMLAMTRPGPQDIVVVVDINRASLAALAPWPWGRDRLAGLIAAIAEAKPKAIGIDFLLAGADERSPAALARRLAILTADQRLVALAQSLPDADQDLARALSKTPVTLGFLLDPDADTAMNGKTPLLMRGNPDLSDVWPAPGVTAPDGALADAATGLGMMALPGDRDGVIRRLPLLVSVQDRLLPGFAVEIVRSARSASALVISDQPARLIIGENGVPLPSDAMLRLRPARAGTWTERTVSALDVMTQPAARERLAGRIVVLGSSAPEAGGLRPSLSDEIAPAVHLQADAVAQLWRGDAPQRPRSAWLVELVTALAAMAAAWLAARARPSLTIVAAAIALALAWVAAAMLALSTSAALIDPVFPPLIGLLSLGTASAFAFADLKLREAAIRRRFEQHLAPNVVRMITEQPHLLKIEGEMREITALFTDVEGFTAMTERIEPRTLVRLLDAYFEGVTRIIVERGGMVDKVVGDGVHALFNAPLDLADHAAHAVAAAGDIHRFTATFRQQPEAAAAGFGRTRIGIETGMAVVGDVGGARKLDYTAHGDAVNTAARLEAANKQLGSATCIGPIAAARVGLDALRPLGRITVRGRAEPQNVYEPWPDTFTPDMRAAYLTAMAAPGRMPAPTRAALEALAISHPDDAPLRRLLVKDEIKL